MADIGKINAVALANIAKVDAVAAAAIAKINGLVFTTAAGAFLLDTYTGAAAGYSTRRLATSATNLMRIREDAGDTETDIGYDSNNQLDTAAIATHCGTANGYVVTWYDQANSNNATQSTETKQPQIYNGTAVITENGKPALEFNQDGFAPITGSKSDILFHTSTQGMLYNVGNYTASQNQLRIIAETNGTSSSKSGFVFGVDDRTSNDYGYYGLTKGTGAGNAIIASLEASFVGAQYLMSIHYDFASGIFQYQNSSLLDSSTSSMAYGTGDATNDLAIGNIAGNYTYSLVGKMQELVLYNEDDTNRTGIEENINSEYLIYQPTDAPTSGLLADYTGAAAAYSVRQLSDKAVIALRVRRDSDDVEQNFGFDSNGDLATADIAAFCGTANGYVTRWWDQSTNGNHADQATDTSQPQIYDGTAVITENGKPSIYWSGTKTLDCGNYSALTVGQSFFVAKSANDPAATGQDGSVQDFGTYGDRNHYPYTNGIIYDDFGSNTRKSFNPTANLSNLHVYSSLSKSNQFTAHINGSQEYTTATNTVSFSSSSKLGSVNMNHHISEFVLYDSDQSTNRTGIETNINDYFSIT